ncbi:tetratricopeptide repeat protein [Pelagicoccus sp. SDUM812003]|uniref:tetratricopeptide repeat protein n=1 Tax=Pelagicoccus sp. SDUM812003 TaxID=3041267 RepID=UPI00280E0400|nr:tetratricopeptide repeat protein [Pelagicoccus sp. SDUM812003]MDQ8205222.1 tetratricopeptide repeat protein [Pelagicoccus sp. SDUM812003]
MKAAKRIVALACVFIGSGLGAQTYPLSENFWKNPEFKNRVLGSYGVHSELEPKLSDTEGEFFKTLIAVLEADLAQGATLLEDRITADSSAALDFMLGTIRMQLGQVDQSIAAYERAIKKFPNFMRAYKNLGIAYIQNQQLEEGIDVIVKGMELGGADGLSYGLLGYSYLNLGLYSSAVNAYSLAIAFDPKSKDWKLGKTRALIELENFEDAAGLVSELIALDPANHELYLHQANVSLAREDVNGAMANLEIARRMGEGDENSLFLLADIYANRGMYDLAIGTYRDALKQTPEKQRRFASVSRAIGSFIENGEWRHALELADIAEAQMADELDKSANLELLNRRAEAQLGANNDAAAAETLEKIIEEDPMNGRALLLLARFSWKQGDIEEAEFLFSRAENIETVASQAYLQHGQLLVEQQSYSEAAKLIRKSLDLEYRSNVADYLRAVEEAASRS